MRIPVSIFALAAALVVGACGGSSGSSSTAPGNGNPGGGGPPPAPAQTNQVAVGDDFFSPSAIQVPVGTTVTWTWAASASAHNVSFTDGQLSGDKVGGATYQRTFGTAGTFSYVCTLHGSMVGSVLVQ